MLAAAGLGSRRECEELVVQGRVEVDGHVADQLGVRVDPQHQQIRVDGVVLTLPKRVYFLVNKPAGVVCTNRDPSGRARVVDLVQTDERVFAVGRLDRSSEGLILVTNDGELANQLTHPRYGVSKVYRVRVAGQLSPAAVEKLLRGIHLAEGQAKVAAIKVRRRHLQSTEMDVTLKEGRNREIRRILARVGHKILQLKRIAPGPLRLGGLPLGAHRRLTNEEVRQLASAARPGDGSGRREAHRERRPERSARPRSGTPRKVAKRAPSSAEKAASARPGAVLADGFADRPTAERPRRKPKRAGRGHGE